VNESIYAGSSTVLKTIMMPGQSSLKFISSLKQKKYRNEFRLFVIEGEKAVDELLESGYGIHSIYATADWIEKHRFREGPHSRPREEPSRPPERSQPRFREETSRPREEPSQPPMDRIGGELPLFEISESGLRKISSMKNPNKVLAVVQIPDFRLEPESLADTLTLVLDNIQDPGNLGTLIRAADWFGIENVILSENSAEVTNPKVVQSTMGSILRVKTHYADLPSFFSLPAISEMPIYGAFAGAPPIYPMQLETGALIVLGNESQGISGRVEKFIKRKIGIPSFPRKGKSPESLNIAIAGSLIISEFRRRMLYPHSK
jgi:RNA methyltransferase, TrmH family